MCLMECANLNAQRQCIRSLHFLESVMKKLSCVDTDVLSCFACSNLPTWIHASARLKKISFFNCGALTFWAVALATASYCSWGACWRQQLITLVKNQ